MFIVYANVKNGFQEFVFSLKYQVYPFLPAWMITFFPGNKNTSNNRNTNSQYRTDMARSGDISDNR
jgi:hypothetical protein